MSNTHEEPDEPAVEETLNRYKAADYAQRYKREYTGGLAPINIRSRMVAAGEVSILRSLLRRIETAGSVLLDIPCGTGKLGRMLAAFPVHVIAADVSGEMMQLAQEEYRPSQLLRFMQCDARQILLEDKSVDIVVSLRLFQRLPTRTRQEILKEFRRVGRRHLLISYSYESLFQSVRRAIRRTWGRDIGTDFHVCVKEIQTELEDAGFVVRSMKHVLHGLSSEVVVLADL